MMSREDADYHYVHSKEIAKNSLVMTDEFLSMMKRLVNQR